MSRSRKLLNCALHCSLLLAAEASCAEDHPLSLRGDWLVYVTNPAGESLGSARVQFLRSEADSCIAGGWRKVKVLKWIRGRSDSFPFNEPLGYRVENGTVIIGRNLVCDAYLQLIGPLEDGSAKGEYVSFGLAHSEVLGGFSAARAQR
jgi:hypothetical protein